MSGQGGGDWRGPLQGIRVLDFTRVLAGPAASLALADLGAEVIKIEPPGGDETRSFPPHREGESHYFLAVNRGKQSLVIDLKTDQGRQLAKRLAAEADVLVENYRPGVMERLGLGYAELDAANPGLVYCSISGFGMDGPLRDRPSFDIVMQAMSGAMSINGDFGGDPLKLGLPMGDLVGGINAPIAILGALFERQSTGQGKYIDISLYDGMLGLLGYYAQLAFFTGESPRPTGSQHVNIVPYGSFRTADGAVVIACLTQAFWSRICSALGLEDIVADARFATLADRRQHRDELNALIEEKTLARSTSEWERIFTQQEVPHAPIRSVLQALGDAHTLARGMVTQVEHTRLGSIPIINRPFRFVGETQVAPTAPPCLGEHTAEILARWLGVDAAETARLREAGIVA